MESRVKTMFGNDWVPDPVIHIDQLIDEGEERVDPGWYFYNETWSELVGPFSSEDEARRACVDYAKSL